jgi:hypothetical protein
MEAFPIRLHSHDFRASRRFRNIKLATVRILDSDRGDAIAVQAGLTMGGVLTRRRASRHGCPGRR